jgi:hypothetical protein
MPLGDTARMGTKAKPLAILNPYVLAALLSALTESGHQSWCRNNSGSFATLAAIRRAS